MSEQLRSLATLWRGGTEREASYADDIFTLLEERDELRERVGHVTVEDFAEKMTTAVQQMRDENSKHHAPGWSRADAALRAVLGVIDGLLLRAEAANDGASREEQLTIGTGYRFKDSPSA